MLGKIQILDNGYVQYIEHMGSDERFIESARMSTDKGFLGWGTPDEAGDDRLLAYLWNNKHSTPFEMGALTLEVKAPIFVFREWMRHRTQSFNEMSARYVPLPCEDYLPSIDRLLTGANTATTNKQAQGNGTVLNGYQAKVWLDMLETLYADAERVYSDGIRMGVPKELARCAITVSRYSKMRVSTDILNWLKFLQLRKAPNAQYEIRVYADAVGSIIEQLYPRTYKLFEADFNKYTENHK